ncbi:MAG: ComF family protein [Gemmatimonadetes bacterium]|nr:ComF family protein [Gemmatimonadota bacterium]
MAWVGWAERAAVELERLLLPNACIACGRRVESRTPDLLVCSVCRARLETATVGCDRCAEPLPPVGPCRSCRDWPAALRRTRSAVWLGREAREIVHRLKYDDCTSLAELAADTMARRLPCPGAAGLIPVPLGERRLRRRGYNQAAHIADALGRRWGRETDHHVLRRVRDTSSQTALTPEARLANVAGAFAAAPPAPGTTGAAVLIDDVLTTGATLCAAAGALAAAGWTDVAAMTFARALPFEIRALRHEPS